MSFQELGLCGNEIAIVTDIGCSGLLDTFFNTHALHGLHGRALTYATGLKLGCPALTVVVIMGDGGLGIGGAHVLSSCRRNLDISLLVLNNFNYGMTGGQCSATTPVEVSTSSGFLGQLEVPLDICAVAGAAGATCIDRVSATNTSLSERISQALGTPGFSLMDITGICPGRLSKRNRQPKKLISTFSESFEKPRKVDPENVRPEYGSAYRKRCRELPRCSPMRPIISSSTPVKPETISVLFLGAAGQRVNTAAEILCLSAMHGGFYATQKNDYPIT
ncbi:MAG: thiamine pyrophosphate-dependent enzyme, partial [Desulfocapsaceae bacterium]